MEDIYQQLLDATDLGDIDSLRRILPDDMPEAEVLDLVNYQDAMGQTPLHIAASNGTADIVQFIANKNAGINMTDSKGRTPLHCACEKGFFDVASYLLDSCAIMEAKDRLGRTPLYVAAEGGFQDIVELLAENGADVNASRVYNKRRRSALIAASAGGHTQVVDVLIKYGAKINSRLKGEDSALLLAVQSGHKDTVNLLINNNADLNYPNSTGETPLIAAVRTGSDEVFDSLLAARSDTRKLNVNAANANGDTPISLAVSNGYVHGVIQLLDVDKIRTNPKLPGGATLVHLAAVGKFNDILEILLDHGLEPDACDEKGDTPLHWAAGVTDNHDVITTLMSWGSDPAIIGYKGKNVFGCIGSRDRATANLVAKLLEDPEISRAISERRQQKAEQAKRDMENARKTLRQSKMETTQTRTRKPAGTSQSKLAVMTRMGGTLRDTKRDGRSGMKPGTTSRARARPQEARPWGGSRETEIFQRDIRCKIREMKREYTAALDEIAQELQALRDEVMGQSSEIFVFSEEEKSQEQVNQTQPADDSSSSSSSSSSPKKQESPAPAPEQNKEEVVETVPEPEPEAQEVVEPEPEPEVQEVVEPVPEPEPEEKPAVQSESSSKGSVEEIEPQAVLDELARTSDKDSSSEKTEEAAPEQKEEEEKHESEKKSVSSEETKDDVPPEEEKKEESQEDQTEEKEASVTDEKEESHTSEVTDEVTNESSEITAEKSEGSGDESNKSSADESSDIESD